MIRPLFPFYGSKWRDARRYASPHNGLVVEPFAGSAGYSLWHEPEQVKLYDVDPIIVGVWQYLINATPGEILSLPDLEDGQSVDDIDIPQEARWLIGFWLNRGSASPVKRASQWQKRYANGSQLVWGERARTRIAASVPSIRHWTIEQSSYADIDTPEATYFVDPPYLDKGKYYRFKDVDYAHLAGWADRLPGQAIVCEQAGAEWLPFEPLATIKSTRGVSAEVMYFKAAA